jgi:hypothetical protein
MEQRFKSLSLFEFQERFSNAADCLKYLADEKWGNGFVCRKCGHTHSCAAKQHNRGNAPAAGTLNHQPPKHCFTKSSSICSRRSTLSTLFPPIKKG